MPLPTPPLLPSPLLQDLLFFGSVQSGVAPVRQNEESLQQGPVWPLVTSPRPGTGLLLPAGDAADNKATIWRLIWGMDLQLKAIVPTTFRLGLLYRKVNGPSLA